MTNLVEVAQLNQLDRGQRKLVRAKGREVALFNIEGTLYAIDNSCSHSTGPLIEGRLSGTMVTCPWHGARFDISDGKCHSGPATTNVAIYPVHVEGEAIFIEIT